MATDPRSIALDEAQQELLTSTADHLGKPWQQVLAEGIRAVAGNGASNGSNFEDESVGEAMRRLGYIGSVKGPPDLSCNPAYMEGFGGR